MPEKLALSDGEVIILGGSKNHELNGVLAQAG